MRILVVEDEKNMAAFISRAVTEESGAVDWAGDGEAGLDLAKTYGVSSATRSIRSSCRGNW